MAAGSEVLPVQKSDALPCFEARSTGTWSRPKTSHLFIDNVRFWSMFAIVALHGTQVFVEIRQPRPELVQIIETPLKFGTIAFFLMSGFLAGSGLETLHPWIYLKRRIHRILPPWLFWIGVMFCGVVARELMARRLHLAPNNALLAAIGHLSFYCFFDTAFWFVPNLLLSLGILLLFRRVHASLRFGAALLFLSLFYAVNIYRNWIPSTHTEALLGFVFYLWLGSYIARHHEDFNRWMARVTFLQLSLLAAFTGLLAFGEARFLTSLGAIDPMNSLRFSNQVYSIVCVLFIYKFSHATWPKFVNVRDNTYGVYLVHPIVLLLLWPVIQSHSAAGMVKHLIASGAGSVLLWSVTALSAYALSLILAKLLANSQKLQWLVGLRSSGV